MKKRFFSALIAMVMLLAMIPAIGVASAEEAITWPAVGEDVTIGGKTYQFAGEIEGGVDLYPQDGLGPGVFSAGAGYVLWDNEDTLTLHNATLSEVATRGGITAVIGVSLCTIILEGKNKIVASADSEDVYGLYLYDNDEGDGYYTITGAGSLEVAVTQTGDPEAQDDYYNSAIRCEDDLLIDGATVSVVAEGTDAYSCKGIGVWGELTLQDAKLVADVESNCEYACAIYVDGMLLSESSTILGSSVSTYDYEANPTNDYGYTDFIESYGDITLIDTVLKAHLQHGLECYGLYTESEILIEKSAVILTYGDESENWSVSGENVTVDESYLKVGGTVTTFGSSYYDEAQDDYVEIPGVLALENAEILAPADAYIYEGYGEGEDWEDQDDRIVFDMEDPNEPGVTYPNDATGITIAPKAFADVQSGIWYEGAVGFCNALGIISGTGNGTTFNPSGTMTRAALVSMLYRMAGSPVVSGSHGFTDVLAGQWYTDAITWASQNGIVNGKGDGKFDPTGAVTRASFVTILYNYSKYCGEDVSAGADLSTFADFEEIPTWAMNQLEWAVDKGLLSGVTSAQGLKINPFGKATRAQGAVLMQQFCVMN